MHAIVLLVGLLTSVHAAATDLKITDSGGKEVLLTGANVDYGGFLGSELETQGIRVLQGDGLVTLKWTDVDSLQLVHSDSSAKPPRVEIVIVLRNGRKAAATLFRQGRMKLLGKTELGDYSIDLDKVRSITPVR